MGAFEIVLKRAWPCSSRLVPVAAPIGFSEALSSVGSRVFSAHSFSGAEGCRPSKTSEIGLSATAGFVTLALGFFSVIRLPTLSLMIEEGCGRDKVSHRPSGWCKTGSDEQVRDSSHHVCARSQ